MYLRVYRWRGRPIVDKDSGLIQGHTNPTATERIPRLYGRTLVYGNKFGGEDHAFPNPTEVRTILYVRTEVIRTIGPKCSLDGTK